MAYYTSQWATMHDDDDFLINPADIAKGKAKQFDDEDEEMLQILSSLENGSADEQNTDWEPADWDAVVKQFLTVYKINRSGWTQVLNRVKEMKLADPSKMFTCQDLVVIAEGIKKKRHMHKR